MTKEQYDIVQQGEDIINESVFEMIMETTLEWIVEHGNLDFNVKHLTQEALDGFKTSKDDIRANISVDFSKF